MYTCVKSKKKICPLEPEPGKNYSGPTQKRTAPKRLLYENRKKFWLISNCLPQILDPRMKGFSYSLLKLVEVLKELISLGSVYEEEDHQPLLCGFR